VQTSTKFGAQKLRFAVGNDIWMNELHRRPMPLAVKLSFLTENRLRLVTGRQIARKRSVDVYKFCTGLLKRRAHSLYTGWEWRNFNASWLSLSSCGQNSDKCLSLWYRWNTLFRQASHHADIFANQRIDCYLNNTINLRPLTLYIMPCYTHKVAILPSVLWHCWFGGRKGTRL